MEHLLSSAVISFATMALGAWAIGVRGRKHHRALMRIIAERLGLETSRNLKHERLSGVIDGFEVTIESAARIFFLEAEATTICVRTQGRVPRALTLVPSESWRALDHLFEGGERSFTLDSVFDARVVVQGDALRAAALLDAKTRQRALYAVGTLGANVCLGALHFDAKTPLEREEDAVRLVETLRALIDLAQRLSLDDALFPARLLENVRTDPHPGVRYRNLSLLLERYPGSHEAEAAIASALEDRSTSPRFLAAVNLGQDGFDHLERIALDEAAPEGLRGRALMAIAKLEPRERVTIVLEQALDSPALDVKIGALEALASIAHVPSSRIKALENLAASGDPKSMSAVVSLVERTRARAFEPMLIGLVEKSGRAFAAGQLVERAILVLADIGSVDAVEPLLDLSRLIIVDPVLKRAARRALEEIQARLGDVDRGRLSIVEMPEGEGALSVAADAGTLSVSDITKPEDL